jgi:hypothetical protein
MKELLMALIAWLSPELHLPVPDHLPTIKFASHCAIQEVAYEGTTHKCQQDGVQAMYMEEVDTIFLPDTWRPDNLYDVSMLLHETAHFVQDFSGINIKSAKCVGFELERPAYDAQVAWLKAAGVDPWTTMKLDQLTMFLLTQCGQNPWEHSRPSR